MLKKLKEKTALAIVIAYGLTGEAQAVGLPTVNAPGGSSSDPLEIIKELFKYGITLIAFVLVALMFITVVKNGWQKYHQLGEEGSKVTWRDLASNMIAGALLVVLAITMAGFAVDILGKGTI
jgi:integrating conjugative element membrane protein, PFL_4702 family